MAQESQTAKKGRNILIAIDASEGSNEALAWTLEHIAKTDDILFLTHAYEPVDLNLYG